MIKPILKPILKLILTLTLYEAAKYITEQYIIYRTQNDDVEAPADFDINDHIHLNDLKAEVSD
ncbi:transcriptional activator RinB [Staphylococcus simulans]|uniref:transcriptional activator RinB n=1 Tax=Staphylococcus simulans TaxID=1286 RepID=UPI003BAC10D4